MASSRDPEQTRHHILQVTAQEMRLNGYKAASLADILGKAEVSKGALYHHFSNKQELGYAVFDEVFVHEFVSMWELPMMSEQPIDALCEWFSCFAEELTIEEIELGCPVCNIAIEMAGVDEGFRVKSVEMFEGLQTNLAESLEQAQQRGQAKPDLNMKEISAFIMAAVQGTIMQGKYGRNLNSYKASIKHLAEYIVSMKA